MPPKKTVGVPVRRATRASIRKSNPNPTPSSNPPLLEDASESLPSESPEITVSTSPRRTVANASGKPSVESLSESWPVKTLEVTSQTSPETSMKAVIENAAGFDGKSAVTDATIDVKVEAAELEESDALESGAPPMAVEKTSQEKAAEGGSNGETGATKGKKKIVVKKVGGAVIENAAGFDGKSAVTDATIDVKVEAAEPEESDALESGAPAMAVEKTSQETAVEGGSNGETGATKGKKKIVVKKVRIVKKIVKKLVPKRVVKSVGVCSNKELGKEETGDGGEKPNSAVVLDSMEVEKHDSSGGEAVEGEETNPAVIVSMEVDNAIVGVENPKPNVGDSEEVENPKISVGGSEEIENLSKSEIFEGEKEGILTDDQTKNPVLETEIGDGNHGDAFKSTILSSVVVVVDKNVDMVGSGDDECVTKIVDMGGGVDAGAKDVVVDRNVDMGGGVVAGANKVRIVKKIVKKLVPKTKRVAKSLGICSNKELGKTETRDGGEKRNPAVSDLMEVEKDVSSVGDASASNSEGIENHKPNAFKHTILTSEDPVVNKNVDLVGGGDGECKIVDMGGGVDARKKEEVKNCDAGGSKGEVEAGNRAVVLSVEALGRRKRRKTEIYIGGLDKGAKEEDIKKVFEEVGEVVEVRLILNSQTRKNKGYAFVRYASAADAQKALSKYQKVEICGKQCGVAPAKGNDTIFLGNIDKKWKNEDVGKLLHEIGIEKIDAVIIMVDPKNIQCNCGSAFLEFETNKDAQNAYKKLVKNDAFGKHHNITVAWAEPVNESDEEETQKVKSVYAEFIPSSWDEKKVLDHFKKFGKIETVVLARNLRFSKRKDFAFVNFTTREAALVCVESLNQELSNVGGSKVNVKVSLAKPIQKGKRVSNLTKKESNKEKPKPTQPGTKSNNLINKRKFNERTVHLSREPAPRRHSLIDERRYSRNAELVHHSREQAPRRHSHIGLGAGSVDVDYPYTLPGRKRPYSPLEDDLHYSNSRGYPRTRLQSSYPVESPSYNALPQGLAMSSRPYYQQQGIGFSSGSLHGITDHASSIQREEAPYHGSNGLYYRY